MIKILYEDNHLIAVYKPVGLLVQSDKTEDETLMDHVKEYLKETYNKPGNVFLGLLHRLDRPVAGIVLFAKTSKGASRLSEQFRAHTLSKKYHALVTVPPTFLPEQTLTHFLQKDISKNIVSVYEKPYAGAKEAKLHYKLLKQKGTIALLEITLYTGRSHQIRAQLAHIGASIIGDSKYGDSSGLVARLPKSAYDNTKGIALLASSLTFHLATKDEEKHIEVSIPKEWEDIVS